jgi:phage host-nuclease inhibitor protein Gam
MPRIKTPSVTIESRAIFEQKIDVIAQQAVSIQTLEAERDKAKEAVLKKYNDQIAAIEKEQESELKLCAAYAGQRRDVLFAKDKRSADTPLATFGFRTGMPQVAKIGKTAEADLATLLHKDGHDEVLSISYNLDKPSILKRLQDTANAAPEWLKKLFKVKQEETFFVTPKAQQETK